MDKENFGLQITDEDIEWVRTIMPDIELDECRIQILKNMNSVDIHACPGSGKTTILVAKLAILSRKWKWQNRGICVLSHTNVAREEIEERLGTLNVGKKLLSYPHFIGTFQAFLDTFIAMPFLRSCGCPVNIIDTDYVLERRWKSIRIKKWLEAHGKDKYVCDPLELPYKLDVKLGTGTATYKNVVKAVTESRRRGEFTFNEMELYAAKGIDSISTLAELIQMRFPVIFIDEAQDTKKEIWELLNKIYEKPLYNSFYQAYGDSNQAIYNSYEKMEDVEYFPRANALQMLNSKRFGAEIAKLANGVALDKSNMIGEGRPFSNNNIQNTIFLFENGQENIVVDKFAELIFRTFSHDELEEYQKYGCHVLGMVHKIDKEMSVKNYFEEYNPEVKKQTPNHLIDYFWIAEEQMEKKGELSLKVEWISKGICKIMRKYPLKEIEKSSSAFNSIIKTVRPENREEIRSGLLEIMCMNWKTKNEWENVIDQILHLLSDVIKYTDARKDEFLFWNGSEKPEEYTKNRNRVNEKEYENESGDKINIKFGSIHSSKGRTHLATLVVETKYYEDNLSSILPWLSGKRPKLGVRNKKRLKCHYVAMTRAKGLLCLAIPRKSVSDQVRKELENFGWNLDVV